MFSPMPIVLTKGTVQNIIHSNQKYYCRTVVEVRLGGTDLTIYLDCLDLSEIPLVFVWNSVHSALRRIA
jgi:hypothetical protein